MTFALDETTVAEMIGFVDRHVRHNGCDHTHRFTSQWSREKGVDWDDLLDALEQRGAFCDCEVVLNLEGLALTIDSAQDGSGETNRWLLPPNFVCTEQSTNRMIVAKTGIGRNNYASDGEWLVPAPVDAKPRKRVRKSVHYFIGIESGLPTEIGFVENIAPISVDDLARKICASTVPELKGCDDRLAGFIAQKIAKLPDDAAVGTDIMDRVGVASKHRELTIHRVILRR
jgi:hypothetical protein